MQTFVLNRLVLTDKKGGGCEKKYFWRAGPLELLSMRAARAENVPLLYPCRAHNKKSIKMRNKKKGRKEHLPAFSHIHNVSANSASPFFKTL